MRVASFPVQVALVLVFTLVLPYVLIQLSPSITRLLFPLYTLIVGVGVIVRWPCSYPAICVAFGTFSPFLRRVADYYAGFQQTNPILLGPLVVLLPSLLWLSRRIFTRGAPMAGAFGLMTACIAYGSVLALFSDKLIQGLYEPAWWLLPPALAAYVLEHGRHIDKIARAMGQTLIVVLPIMTVYGVLQFVAPLPWDLVWMLNVDNATFGRPEPYGIRVFSMMNSPGTTSFFVAYAIIFMCGGSLLSTVMAIAALPLLMLTLVRTAWFSTAAGLLALALVGSGGKRMQLVLALVGGASLIGVMMATPAVPIAIKNVVMDRVLSIGSLGTDSSANDRRDTYASFWDRLAVSPFGEGFGANGSAISATQKRDLPALDSGILESLLTFGVPIGCAYFVSLSMFVAACWRGLKQSQGKLAAAFGLLVAIVVDFPFGLSHVGEFTPLEWTAIGMLLVSSLRTETWRVA